MARQDAAVHMREPLSGILAGLDVGMAPLRSRVARLLPAKYSRLTARTLETETAGQGPAALTG